MKFGDLIFVKGNNFFSKCVKWRTNSKYSHVGFVIDEFHIAEINWYYGFKIRHIKYNKNNFDVYRYKYELTHRQKQEMKKYIHSCLNQKYDFREIFRILFSTKNLKDNKNKIVCSEILYDIFKSCDIELNQKEYSSPQDLINGKLLYKL